MGLLSAEDPHAPTGAELDSYLGLEASGKLNALIPLLDYGLKRCGMYRIDF